MEQQLCPLPQQRPIFSLQMRQALEVLQMPQLELAQWLRKEIDKNPLLEERRPPSMGSSYENVPAQLSLYDHLMRQIDESFPSSSKKRLALALLEQLDERGFLSLRLEEIAKLAKASLEELEEVLSILQSFDPPGIFARSLQETLLLQLRALGEGLSSSYLLVRDCFKDLLEGRFQRIKKRLGAVDLATAVGRLAKLSMRPARLFCQERAPPTQIPDLSIVQVEKKWLVEVVSEELPQVEIRTDYAELTPSSKEEKRTLREWSLSAQWLLRSLRRRHQILLQLGELLVKKQLRFLMGKGPLISLNSQEVAQELGLHESTLSRAIADKVISTPQGNFLLRSFLTRAAITEKQTLKLLIAQEEKPLTDKELSKALKRRGFSVARRTVAKYRKELKIGSRAARKHLSSRKPL